MQAELRQRDELLDRSNELGLDQLACGDKSAPRYRDLETYNFVLGVAWDQRDSVSPDEANLLAKLRLHLRINEFEHRILEAKLRRFPKTGNELHTRAEINAARRGLHQSGVLFSIRQEDGRDYDLIPAELATELRRALRLEIRSEAYREMFKFWKVRTKAHLTEVLEKNNVPLSFPGFPGHPTRRVSSGLVHGIEDDTEAEEAHRRVQA